jgi:acyl-homoserine lactone acylase PvdQ
VRRDWGTIQVPWSEAARLQRRQSGVEEPFRDELPSVGIGGLPDGSLFALQTVPGNGRRRYGWRGTAAVLVTELARPPRTLSVVAYGQSADTASPHFFDQAPRYAAGQLKDAGWLNNVSTSQAGRSEPGGTRRRYHPGQRAQVLQGETTAR